MRAADKRVEALRALALHCGWEARCGEEVQRCVEEDVAIGGVCGHRGEGGVAGAYDGDGAGREGAAVPVAEVAAGAEDIELVFDNGEERGAVGFEVYEEDEGLGGVFVEDAVAGEGAVFEGGCGVLFVEDLDEGVDVEVAEGAVLGERGGAVADVELIVDEPNVCFDTCAAEVNSLV